MYRKFRVEKKPCIVPTCKRKRVFSNGLCSQCFKVAEKKIKESSGRITWGLLRTKGKIL